MPAAGPWSFGKARSSASPLEQDSRVLLGRLWSFIMLQERCFDPFRVPLRVRLGFPSFRIPFRVPFRTSLRLQAPGVEHGSRSEGRGDKNSQGSHLRLSSLLRVYSRMKGKDTSSIREAPETQGRNISRVPRDRAQPLISADLDALGVGAEVAQRLPQLGFGFRTVGFRAFLDTDSLIRASGAPGLDGLRLQVCNLILRHHSRTFTLEAVSRKKA